MHKLFFDLIFIASLMLFITINFCRDVNNNFVESDFLDSEMFENDIKSKERERKERVKLNRTSALRICVNKIKNKCYQLPAKTELKQRSCVLKRYTIELMIFEMCITECALKTVTLHSY